MRLEWVTESCVKQTFKRGRDAKSNYKIYLLCWNTIPLHQRAKRKLLKPTTSESCKASGPLFGPDRRAGAERAVEDNDGRQRSGPRRVNLSKVRKYIPHDNGTKLSHGRHRLCRVGRVATPPNEPGPHLASTILSRWNSARPRSNNDHQDPRASVHDGRQ